MDINSFKVMSPSTVVKVVVGTDYTALSFTSNWLDEARNFQMMPEVTHSKTGIYHYVLTGAFNQPYVGSVAFEEEDLVR